MRTKAATINTGNGAPAVPSIQASLTPVNPPSVDGHHAAQPAPAPAASTAPSTGLITVRVFNILVASFLAAIPAAAVAALAAVDTVDRYPAASALCAGFAAFSASFLATAAGLNALLLKD